MTQLQQVMAQLDKALTGKDDAARHGFSNVTRWSMDAEGAWYLSDGGYSRILCDFEGGCHLFLASVSRPQVFERWASTVDARERAEAIIREQWQRLIAPL